MQSLKSLTTTTFIVLGIASGFAIAKEDKGKNMPISVQQAISIATNAMPGEISEVELEMHKGQRVWELELTSAEDDLEYEFTIDAKTGKVLQQELDSEDGFWELVGFKAWAND